MDTTLIGFKAICTFINDLDTAFGRKHKPLRLYKRLINHTQICHDVIIKKHIDVFLGFLNRNMNCVKNRDKNLIDGKIAYSDRVFIDMKHIFTLTGGDNETIGVIWKHLLTILAIINPESNAKEILSLSGTGDKKGMGTLSSALPIPGSDDIEANFLTDIISKVEGSVKPDTDPMQAIQGLMSSGIMTDMMTQLGSKKMDIGKLLGAVQGMVGKLQTEVGDDPDSKQAMGMLNTVTSMMGSMKNGGAPPDMAGMMGMLGGLMKGGAGTGPKVDELD